MRREKRARKIQGSVEPSMYEQLELFAEQDGVISMSDYLHRVLDEHVTMRIARQKIGRRVGNQ